MILRDFLNVDPPVALRVLLYAFKVDAILDYLIVDFIFPGGPSAVEIIPCLFNATS